MSYIFENGNSNKEQQKKSNNTKYTLWMNSILRRSKEIGKVELPICSIILDERGRCIGRGVNRRNINKDPLGHAEIMALRQASLIKMGLYHSMRISSALCLRRMVTLKKICFLRLNLF